VIWGVLLLAVLFAMYIYFTGNCQFYNPFVFNEENEVSNVNWVRGLVTLMFVILDCYSVYLWTFYFFVERRIRLATFCLFVGTVLCVVTLWAIGSTTQCRGDYITNRNWILFGMYLVFTIWHVVVLWMSCYWWSTLGSVFVKTLADNPAYYDYKVAKTDEKTERKQERYGEHHGKFYYGSEVLVGNLVDQQQTQKVERMPYGSAPVYNYDNGPL
jgi:hypothetical protein